MYNARPPRRRLTRPAPSRTCGTSFWGSDIRPCNGVDHHFSPTPAGGREKSIAGVSALTQREMPRQDLLYIPPGITKYMYLLCGCCCTEVHVHVHTCCVNYTRPRALYVIHSAGKFVSIVLWLVDWSGRSFEILFPCSQERRENAI